MVSLVLAIGLLAAASLGHFYLPYMNERVEC